MIKLKSFVSELSQKDIYFPTYTAAINASLEYAEKEGYETDPEELADIIGLKSKRPKVGETTTVHVPLYKDGKPQKKWLHIMVYGMENSFELTKYIN